MSYMFCIKKRESLERALIQSDQQKTIIEAQQPSVRIF
jgi:hypothetical protein